MLKNIFSAVGAPLETLAFLFQAPENLTGQKVVKISDVVTSDGSNKFPASEHYEELLALEAPSGKYSIGYGCGVNAGDSGYNSHKPFSLSDRLKAVVSGYENYRLSRMDINIAARKLKNQAVEFETPPEKVATLTV